MQRVHCGEAYRQEPRRIHRSAAGVQFQSHNFNTAPVGLASLCTWWSNSWWP